MPEKSRLMPISYYNPKQEIRLSAYADTIVLEPDGREQHLRAIRFRAPRSKMRYAPLRSGAFEHF